MLISSVSSVTLMAMAKADELATTGSGRSPKGLEQRSKRLNKKNKKKKKKNLILIIENVP